MNLLLIFAIGISLFTLITIAALFYLWVAKKSLIRGGTSWSAKEIPIKRNRSQSKNKETSSFLESIASQSKDYLESEEQLNSQK